MKKVVIVGGGIAGLAAGIYAQKAGFSSEIYEKNPIAGGQCMGWNRGEYHIDNCIHWLTGSKKGTELRNLWEEIGALEEDTEFVELDSFYAYEKDGKRITMWRDLDRTEAEMLEIAPEDEEEIHRFIQMVRNAECCEMPVSKPMDKMTLLDYINMGKKMAPMAQVSKAYGKMEIWEMGERFKNPMLKTAISSYMAKEFYATAFIVSYATITSGNGDIPAGGSLAMTERIVKRYKELGGKLHTNAGVRKVCIEGRHATGIELETGKKISADFVLLASDAAESFHKLLGTKYMGKNWKRCYADKEKYPVTSGLQMAFSAPEEECRDIQCIFFDCEPFQAASRIVENMSVKNYAYEKSFAPEGRTVLQTNILQYAKDFDYWKGLNKEEYLRQKETIAAEVLKRIEKHYPRLKGKLELLDCWTPLTYERYCNSYKGAYMSFVTRKGVKAFQDTGKIKKLDNVLLATQWIHAQGGLPAAASAGKFAVGRMKG